MWMRGGDFAGGACSRWIVERGRCPAGAFRPWVYGLSYSEDIPWNAVPGRELYAVAAPRSRAMICQVLWDRLVVGRSSTMRRTEECIQAPSFIRCSRGMLI